MKDKVVWVSVNSKHSNNIMPYHYDEQCYTRKDRIYTKIPTLESAAQLAGLRACRNCAKMVGYPQHSQQLVKG